MWLRVWKFLVVRPAKDVGQIRGEFPLCLGHRLCFLEVFLHRTKIIEEFHFLMLCLRPSRADRVFSSWVEGWPVYWVERSAGSATHLRQPLAIGTFLEDPKSTISGNGARQAGFWDNRQDGRNDRRAGGYQWCKANHQNKA